MRGALEPLPGVRAVHVRPGRKWVAVDFDPRRIGPEEMLAALKKAREEASLRPAPAARPPAADPLPLEPIRAVVEAFQRFPIVALVEPAGLEEEHAFIAALIRDPGFQSSVNDIVVEFGNSLYQETVDRHVAGEEVPRPDLTRMWRDSLYSPFGAWDAPVYERFFANVRSANRDLPPSRRLRVIVAGAPIDWSRIATAADHVRFRESYGPEKPHLAALVTREVLARGRRALIIGSRERLLRRGGENDLAVIEKARPRSVLVAVPHLGFEARNGELEPRLVSWPRPALAWLKGTWAGDHYDDELTLAEVADAYLYLGPRDVLKVSQPDPGIYRDDAYFAELARRYGIQAGDGGEPFDRAELLKERPRRFIDLH